MAAWSRTGKASFRADPGMKLTSISGMIGQQLLYL